MNPNALRGLLTGGTAFSFIATVLGASAQIPQLHDRPLLILFLGCLGSFFAGWAHMTKPGDSPKAAP